jgi:hypothetical protein
MRSSLSQTFLGVVAMSLVRRSAKSVGHAELQALESRLLLCANGDEIVGSPIVRQHTQAHHLHHHKPSAHLDRVGNFIHTNSDPAPDSGLFTSAVSVLPSALPLSSIPTLDSNPAATTKLYLDFDGDAPSTWGSYSVPATPAYDTDGDPTTFSDAELANIQQIWARVAEKYSPFNLNVTTVDPGTFANQQAGHIVIGGNGAWTGGTYGGVSYVGGFYNSSSNTSYVFPANLGGGDPHYTAEASSHEAGHLFGLQHQSTYSGTTKTAEYNQGNSLVAPVMGNSYYAARGIWWYGTSTSSTTIQDDMAVISGSSDGFGYRTDDVGNSISTASALTLSGSSVSGAGIVEKTTDRDYFSFNTDSGTLTFSANVAQYGPTLDLALELWSASGTLIASADTASLGETITAIVPGGSYRLAVVSHGSYGDVGQYSISGTIVPPVNFTPAPSALAATVISRTQINLAWTDNSTNETGFVIQRSSDGGATWTDLAALAADSTSYSDASVLPGSNYSYRVYAAAPTNSDFSNVASATTVPPAPANLVATATSISQISLSWSDVTGETGYLIRRSTDGVTWSQVGSTPADAITFIDSGLAMGTTYFYSVLAIGVAGNSESSNVASATTQTLSPPTAPTNVTATVLARNKIKVTWTDTSNNETGFHVQISSDGVNWSLVGTMGANVTSYTDNGVRRGSYYYRVSAYNAAGDSAFTQSPQVSLGAIGDGLDGIFSTTTTSKVDTF